MSGSEPRLAKVRALVAAEPAPDDVGALGTVGLLEQLCRAAVRALPADGAGISVMTASRVRLCRPIFRSLQCSRPRTIFIPVSRT